MQVFIFFGYVLSLLLGVIFFLKQNRFCSRCGKRKEYREIESYSEISGKKIKSWNCPKCNI